MDKHNLNTSSFSSYSIGQLHNHLLLHLAHTQLHPYTEYRNTISKGVVHSEYAFRMDSEEDAGGGGQDPIVSMGSSCDRNTRCYKKCYEWCWIPHDTNNVFPPIRIFFLVGTCIFYVADVGTDIFAACEHFLAWKKGEHDALNYFIATVVFIIAPTLIINFLSLSLYTWSYIYTEKHGLKRKLPLDYEIITSRNIRHINWTGCNQLALKIRNRCKFNKLGTSQCSNGGLVLSNRNDIPLNDLHSNHSDNGNPENGVEETDLAAEFYPLDKISPKEFVLIVILHVLQIGFLYRVIRLFHFCKKDTFSFDRYRDISFLRLMEGFLESAPQLLLQLYILVLEDIGDPWRKAATAIVVIVSMASLALAVGDYVSAGKDILYYDPPPNRERKPRLSWTGYFLIILWHFSMIVSRGLAISLFASEYGLYVFLIGAVHYVVMVYWMYRQDSILLKRKLSDYDREMPHHCCQNYGIEFLAAAFNVFFLFKLNDKGSLPYITAFYTLFFFENIIMICLWYVHVDYLLNLWYLEAAPIGVVLGFVIGLMFMFVYYKFFQPSNRPDLPRNQSVNHPLMMTATLNYLYRIEN